MQTHSVFFNLHFWRIHLHLRFIKLKKKSNKKYHLRIIFDISSSIWRRTRIRHPYDGWFSVNDDAIAIYCYDVYYEFISKACDSL